MKIVISVNTSWNIYNFRMGLIEAFLKESHEVVAVAPRDNFTERIVKAGCDFYPIEIQNKGSNPLKDIFLTIKYYLLYKRIKPDVILQFTIKPNIYGTLAAKALGVPVINNVSGLGTVFLHANLVSKIALFLYQISFHFAAKVLFQNSFDLKLFIDKKIVRPAQTGLLPGSGVDLKKFQPEFLPKNDTFTFILIARLLFDKGIVEYIEAIKILRTKNIKAKYKMIGALDQNKELGVKEDVLKEWVDEGLVEYLGFSEDIKNVIAHADCVVLPSYREGTSRTLLEAAAMGKPLIAADVPGCMEVVDHGVNGYLCKVKDADDLADKMMKMAQLPDVALKNMSIASREKVCREFDEKKIIEIYLSLLKSIPDKK